MFGPKDLPIIARLAGRLAGRSIGYVQLARGHFDNVMQQSQARQNFGSASMSIASSQGASSYNGTTRCNSVQIRSLSLMNPGPVTRRLMESPLEPASDENVGKYPPEIYEEENNSTDADYNLKSLASTDLHIQTTVCARLAESEAAQAGSARCSVEEEDLNYEFGDFSFLPVSAESAGFLPDRKESAKGSDIVVEGVVEAEVARNAKDFFSLPQNQIW
ncbi:hypothetical protein DITRI_Ditri15bG0089700 [Diplodiscus trichospermus]